MSLFSQRQVASDLSRTGFDSLKEIDPKLNVRLNELTSQANQIVIYLGYLLVRQSKYRFDIRNIIVNAINDGNVEVLGRIASRGDRIIHSLSHTTTARDLKEFINPNLDDIVGKSSLSDIGTRYLSQSNNRAYMNLTSPDRYSQHQVNSILSYIGHLVNNNMDDVANHVIESLGRGLDEYPNTGIIDGIVQESVDALNIPDTSLTPLSDFATQYREDVGGPIWRRIVKDEKNYINMLMNSQRDSERPDLNNPVGGLIDVTDHMSSILDEFNRPNTSNWLVGKEVSDEIETNVTSYDWNALQQDIMRGRSNFAIAGGFPLSMVAGTDYSDIDLFMIIPGAKSNPQPELWAKEVKDYALDIINSGEYGGNMVISDHSVTLTNTISSQLKNRYGEAAYTTVQVILRVYHSLTEVLTGFDIGACGVGLYNGRLYATERAIYEIVNRTIMVSMNRASTSYPYRLIKYALKGFGLYVEGVESFKPIDADYATRHTGSILELIDLYIRYGGWIHEKVPSSRGVRRVGVDIQFPIGMSSDYSKVNDTGARDILDYGHNTRLVNRSELDNLKDKIIYVNPFRQGSLSFHPVKIPLRQWAGVNAVIDTSKIISDIGDVLLYRILNSVYDNLADRLSNEYDGHNLTDYELIERLEAMYTSTSNYDIADRIALSLVRLYRLR